MMGVFLLALVLSIWKVYEFLPNKELEDDDNTQASLEQLTKIMLETIQKSAKPLSEKGLFLGMKANENFDEKHFWRFNENKLNQLLQRYYTLHHINSIQEIEKKLKA